MTLRDFKDIEINYKDFEGTLVGARATYMVQRVHARLTQRPESVWGEYAEQKGPFQLERVNPEPYSPVGEPWSPADIEAFRTHSAHMTPFLFEVVDVKVLHHYNQKLVQIQAKVMPRAGDTESVGNDGKRGSDGTIKLTFHGHFEHDRPDAVCIRELMMLALRHELEECIMVGPRRVWDPHIARPQFI